METLCGRHDYQVKQMHGHTCYGFRLDGGCGHCGKENCGVSASVKHRVECPTQQPPAVVCVFHRSNMYATVLSIPAPQ